MSWKLPERWDDFQEEILTQVEEDKHNLVISAVAGSGKTTTALGMMARLPSYYRVQFLAFNRDIAAELAAIVPEGRRANTFHSFATGVLAKSIKGWKLDARKGKKIARRVLEENHIRTDYTGEDTGGADPVADLAKAASLSKLRLVSDLVEVAEIIQQYELAKALPLDEMPDLVRKCLDYARNDLRTVDFDDQLWIPLRLDLPIPHFDVVICDESQDLGNAQIEYTLRAGQRRVYCVGDPLQRIYEFAGVDAGAFDRMTATLGARVLPLSITYRCARAIVAYLKPLCPQLEARPGAPEGEVNRVDKLFDGPFGPQPGDFVLSRTNAPLIFFACLALKKGIPANILGRDLGFQICDVGEQLGASRLTKPEWLQAVRRWADMEESQSDDDAFQTASEASAAKQAKVDVAASILAIADWGQSPKDCLDRVRQMFVDRDPAGLRPNVITFSTTHKSKGLAAETVWLLDGTYDPTETNLYYVAGTRAKNVLNVVSAKALPGKYLARGRRLGGGALETQTFLELFDRAVGRAVHE